MREETQNQTNEVKDESEVETLEEVFSFRPSGMCRYRQRGPYLVCVSCEVQHAVYIGMDRMMIGEDEEGKPILTRVKV